MEIDLRYARAEWSQRPLPRPNKRLTALALRLARCAAHAIEIGGRTALIGVTVDRGILRLTWWNDRMLVWGDLAAPPSAFCPANSIEGALQRAGAAMLDYFAGRWPDGASPMSLGVVTDGVGVAFSPNYPAPCVPGWLELHGRGAARALTILPFRYDSTFVHVEAVPRSLH